MRCPIAHPPLRRENIEKEMGLMRECVCAHADIYVVADEDGAQMVMKIHRCGATVPDHLLRKEICLLYNL